MTNGRFVITPYEAGELVPALNVFDAVRSAEVECGHTSSLYYLDLNPSLVFGTTPALWPNALPAVCLVLLWRRQSSDGDAVRAFWRASLSGRKRRHSDGGLDEARD